MGKTANRERWRADLHDYRAALLTGAGLTAEGHDLAADLCREHANLCDELEPLRAALLADPTDETAAKTYKAKAAQVHEFRRLWRSYGDAAGTRTLLAALNDFNEPTNEELAR